MTPLRIGFVVEQALGHITHSRNLQALVPEDPEVAPTWIFPRWIDSGLISRLPLFKSNWTVQASLQARRELARLPAAERPQALFFHTQVTATLAQNWLRRIPSIVSLDATPLQYDALGEVYAHDAGPAWLEQVKWRLNCRTFALARHVVTWSEWAREGLTADYEVPPEKITIIPPGVDVESWARPEDGRPAAAGPVRLLFVGGDLERKGGRELLDAFRALYREAAAGELPSLELHLVTRDRVPAEPGVHVYNDLTPNSERLRALYRESDIFCLPTRGDCLPMALAEAGAAGLPLVSTPVGAISELVREGETGRLVPAGDAARLAEGLRSLVRQPERRREWGDRAAALVASQHDARRNAARLLALLKQLARTGEITDNQPTAGEPAL